MFNKAEKAYPPSALAMQILLKWPYARSFAGLRWCSATVFTKFVQS